MAEGVKPEELFGTADDVDFLYETMCKIFHSFFSVKQLLFTIFILLIIIINNSRWQNSTQEGALVVVL